MFTAIRRKLLLSYLLVFSLAFGIFVAAVRIFFIHKLEQEFNNELIALGEGAIASVQFKDNKVHFDNKYSINEIKKQHQALQWFEASGNLIYQQGDDFLIQPLLLTGSEQIQGGTNPIKAITLGIYDNNNKLIGYVRVSQSLKSFNDTISKLDRGLVGGMIFALAISAIGGVFLMRQSMKPIEKSFQHLQQFTADASHELRSPLMVIKTNASVALKYSQNIRENDIEKFTDILSAVEQMSSLTNDLLLLARTNKLEKNAKENIDIGTIIQDIIAKYQPQVITKEINLQLMNPDTHQVWGDGLQLRRLFTNLIENAIFYTDNGGSISISINRDFKNIYIHIKDTGIGIASENIERVFDRLWRADTSRYYHGGGSGLGLAIARVIAQNHGGFITLKSQLGVGSCFTVYLPLKK